MMASLGKFETLGKIRNDATHEITKSKMSRNPRFHTTHDNALHDTARHTQNILRIHNINVLQWPARSQDLSPIEHLLDHLGRQVREHHDVNKIHGLVSALQAEWVRIPLQVIRKLICSMRRRCLAVLAVNEGHTRYA